MRRLPGSSLRRKSDMVMVPSGVNISTGQKFREHQLITCAGVFGLRSVRGAGRPNMANALVSGSRQQPHLMPLSEEHGYKDVHRGAHGGLQDPAGKSRA